LDVGCGKGGDAAKVPPHLTLTGVDIAEDALAEARRRFPHPTFLKGDFSKPLPLSPHAFDAAWSSFAFHYAGDALDVALKNVRAVLKPGALFLFLVLDENMETTHPRGCGPLSIARWEHRDVGPHGTCASATKCWVSFEGSFAKLPENILTRAQIEGACSGKFAILRTELLASCVEQLFNWATTPEQMQARATLEQLRERFPHKAMWDSTHFEFANCYRVWLLQSL
jgi:ubiquinone/menaquinone biosynthesis C-methylase UbiE